MRQQSTEINNNISLPLRNKYKYLKLGLHLKSPGCACSEAAVTGRKGHQTEPTIQPAIPQVTQSLWSPVLTYHMTISLHRLTGRVHCVRLLPALLSRSGKLIREIKGLAHMLSRKGWERNAGPLLNLDTRPALPVTQNKSIRKHKLFQASWGRMKEKGRNISSSAMSSEAEMSRESVLEKKEARVA